jgi:hypothetical protein
LSPRRMSSMKCWNVWAALCRAKDMKGNWYRPNKVVMAVFCMSSVWTGFGFKLATGRFWRTWNNRKAGGSNLGMVQEFRAL